MLTPDLQDIIKKAQHGDSAAFRVIVEKHQSFVYNVAYRMVNSKDEAQDITQEVFVALWKQLSRYKPENKLSTWLYTMVTNRCLDYFRSREFRNSQNSKSIESFEGAGPTSPDQEMMNNELNTLIHAYAEQLTPKQKAAFVLRDLEGLSLEEVAEILNESKEKIKSNLYYARLKMQEWLKDYVDEKRLKL